MEKRFSKYRLHKHNSLSNHRSSRTQYNIEEINLYPNTKSPIDNSKIYSGDFLMKVRFNPEANTNKTSFKSKEIN